MLPKHCVFVIKHKQGSNKEPSNLLANKTLEGKIIQTLQGERELTIQDVNLSCYYPQGTVIKREANCNSPFMLSILPQIANEIQLNLHWIPCQERIYLVIDNAGGHGTREARDECI
jgi:hypothetical protein